MPTTLLPDLVAVTIQALSAQPSLTALVSTRVYDRLPATPTWPLLVVNTVDEGETPFAGIARVQVDVWGAGPTSTDEEATRTIARTLVSVSRDLRGNYAAGHISNSGHLNTVPLPDPTTGRARFAVDLDIEAYPL